MEDAMTTFRKTLMATTMLAGLAIAALDTAQAGPNGPNIGSISGFSSMRMDFNRIGSPSRSFSRDEARVVPLDVTRKTEKSAGKNTAKKGTDIARMSSPKSANGGKDKEVASAPALRIPAPLAEIYRVTGGNLDDISKLAELASWLKSGPLAAGNTFFTPKGDGTFVPPALGADGRFGWGDASGGAGNNTPQRIGNPNGKAGNDGDVSIQIYGDGTSTVTTIHPNGRDFTVTDYGPTRMGDNGTVVRPERRITTVDGRTTREPWRKVAYDIDDPAINGGFKDGPANYADSGRRDRNAPRNSTGGENEDRIVEGSNEETSGGENPDSQPVEEGAGRSRGMHTVRCDIAGCIDLGMSDGRRVNPGHPDGSNYVVGAGGLPSWATDPCPDCSGGVSGGGFYRPGGSDLGWRGPAGGDGGSNPPLPEPL
jgi:hypothetical protein